MMDNEADVVIVFVSHENESFTLQVTLKYDG